MPGISMYRSRNFSTERHTWVLSGMKLNVLHQPILQSDIRVMTWPNGFERLVACRSFLVVDSDDRVLATGESNWLIIDVQSRRPVRIEQFVQHISTPDGATAYRIPRIPAPDSPVFGHHTTVSETDIDINNHTNNISYIKWLIESIPVAFRTSHDLSGMEINYLAETMLGDCIEAGRDNLNDGDVLHIIRRVDDGREIVRARSCWVRDV